MDLQEQSKFKEAPKVWSDDSRVVVASDLGGGSGGSDAGARMSRKP